MNSKYLRCGFFKKPKKMLIISLIVAFLLDFDYCFTYSGEKNINYITAAYIIAKSPTKDK